MPTTLGQGLAAHNVPRDSQAGQCSETSGAAIAEALRAAGHEVVVVNLHREKAGKAALAESGFLVLCGPTLMKHMSRRALKFTKKLGAGALEDTRAAARQFAADL